MTAVPSIIRLNSSLPAAPSGYMNVKPQHDGNFPFDDTSFYVPNLGGKDPRTTTSETIGLASQGKLVTLTNAGAIAVTLDSTVPNYFLCAVQVDGAGGATFTPSSGQINGASSASITGGSKLGGWLFFDGTNWWLFAAANSLPDPVTVPHGGTGDTTLAAHAVLIGEGTSPVATAAPSSAGQVLTDNGASADPSFKLLPLTIGFVMNTGVTGTNVGPELAAPRAGQITKCKIVTKASDGSTDLTIKIKQNGVDVFSADPTVAHGTSAGTVSTFTALTSSPLSVAADDVFTIDISSGTANWQFTAQLES